MAAVVQADSVGVEQQIAGAVRNRGTAFTRSECVTGFGYRIAAVRKADVAVIERLAEGLLLLTSLQGYGGSSARMELVESIVAIVASMPAHIGTYS